MVEIFQDKAGGWRYRVKGANGEIMVSSEAYSQKWNATDGLAALIRVLGQPDLKIEVVEDFL